MATAVGSVTTAAILTMWIAGVLPDSRVVLAVYLTCVLATGTSVAVQLLARCHLAIAAAFSAGFHAGQHAHIDVDPMRQAEVRRQAQAEGRPVVSLVK